MDADDCIFAGGGGSGYLPANGRAPPGEDVINHNDLLRNGMNNELLLLEGRHGGNNVALSLGPAGRRRVAEQNTERNLLLNRNPNFNRTLVTDPNDPVRGQDRIRAEHVTTGPEGAGDVEMLEISEQAGAVAAKNYDDETLQNALDDLQENVELDSGEGMAALVEVLERMDIFGECGSFGGRLEEEDVWYEIVENQNLKPVVEQEQDHFVEVPEEEDVVMEEAGRVGGPTLDVVKAVEVHEEVQVEVKADGGEKNEKTKDGEMKENDGHPRQQNQIFAAEFDFDGEKTPTSREVEPAKQAVSLQTPCKKNQQKQLVDGNSNMKIGFSEFSEMSTKLPASALFSQSEDQESQEQLGGIEMKLLPTSLNLEEALQQSEVGEEVKQVEEQVFNDEQPSPPRKIAKIDLDSAKAVEESVKVSENVENSNNLADLQPATALSKAWHSASGKPAQVVAEQPFAPVAQPKSSATDVEMVVKDDIVQERSVSKTTTLLKLPETTVADLKPGVELVPPQAAAVAAVFSKTTVGDHRERDALRAQGWLNPDLDKQNLPQVLEKGSPLNLADLHLFDRVLLSGCGFRHGQLVELFGEAGSGKTALLADIAAQAVKNQSDVLDTGVHGDNIVYVFDGNLGKGFLKRLQCAHAGSLFGKVRYGAVHTGKDVLEGITFARKEMEAKKLPAHLAQHKDANKAGGIKNVSRFLIVENLMETLKREPPFLPVSEIVKKLQKLADDFGLTVLISNGVRTDLKIDSNLMTNNMVSLGGTVLASRVHTQLQLMKKSPDFDFSSGAVDARATVTARTVAVVKNDLGAAGDGDGEELGGGKLGMLISDKGVEFAT
eukprot:g8391.t1